MSVSGTKPTSTERYGMSVFSGKADIPYIGWPTSASDPEVDEPTLTLDVPCQGQAAVCRASQ